MNAVDWFLKMGSTVATVDEAIKFVQDNPKGIGDKRGSHVRYMVSSQNRLRYIGRGEFQRRMALVDADRPDRIAGRRFDIDVMHVRLARINIDDQPGKFQLIDLGQQGRVVSGR